MVVAPGGRHSTPGDGTVRLSSHDCRITAAADASMRSRWACCRFARRGWRLGGCAGRSSWRTAHRRCRPRSRTRARPRRWRPPRRAPRVRPGPTLPDNDRGRPTTMRVASASAAAATIARWSSARTDARSSVSYGLARTPDGSLSASPIRRSPRSTPSTRPGPTDGAVTPADSHGAAEERERVVDRVDVLPAALHRVGVLGGAAAERLRRVAGRARRRHPRFDPVLAHRDREARLAAEASTPTSATTPEPSASRVAMARVRRSTGREPVAADHDRTVGGRRRERARLGGGLARARLRRLRPRAP